MSSLAVFAILLLWGTEKLQVEACTKSSTQDKSTAAKCIFPSIGWSGTTIKQCLPSTGGLWCPTTGDYCSNGKFMWCPNTELTFGGSDPGNKCAFPFKYGKKSYYQCTKIDSVPPDTYFWCATKADYDSQHWTKCKDVPEILPCHFHSGGVGISKECIFENREWRCQTPNGDKRVCPSAETTEAGNDPGKPCHFPFLHEGIRHNSCKLYDQQNEKYDWCSTTDSFDRDRLWTRCKVKKVFRLEGILLLLVIVASILVGACLLACIIYALSEIRIRCGRCLKRRRQKANKEESEVVSARDSRPLTPTAPPIEDAPPAYDDVIKTLARSSNYNRSSSILSNTTTFDRNAEVESERLVTTDQIM